MIYNWDQKLKKWLHIQYIDIIIKKPKTLSLAQRMHFFTIRVPNDRHCVCLSNKSLSYELGCIYFEILGIYGEILFSCTITNGSSFTPNCAYSYVTYVPY